MTKDEGLRLALEGAANYIDVLGGDSKKYRQLLAQPAPVQEPVAWMYEVNGAHTCLDLFEPPDDAYDEGTLHPLYTTPPAAVVNQQLTTKPAAQRQWVGLTDEEITALKRNGERYISSQDFARAVLAKSKEKNNG